MSSRTDADAPLARPTLLTATHDTSEFRSGDDALDEFLHRFALLNQRNRSARTFVATRGTRVVGFYSLAAGSVTLAAGPPRVSHGLARHPVPVIVLARLAVDDTERGRGLGAALLRDAILRALQAAESIGCRALIVHAKNATARSFYERWGFTRSPLDDRHLFLLLKDAQGTIAEM